MKAQKQGKFNKYNKFLNTTKCLMNKSSKTKTRLTFHTGENSMKSIRRCLVNLCGTNKVL